MPAVSNGIAVLLPHVGHCMYSFTFVLRKLSLARFFSVSGASVPAISFSFATLASYYFY